MNIDKWDLFGICESLLLVSDRPLTVEQVVETLLLEQETELERIEEADTLEFDDEQTTAPADVEPVVVPPLLDVNAGGFASFEDVTQDPVFIRDLRSDAARLSESLEPIVTDESAPSMADGSELVAQVVAVEEPVAAPRENKPVNRKEEAQKLSASESRRMNVVRRELANLVEDAFAALMHVYGDPDRKFLRGFSLIEVGGGYQLRTNTDYAPFVRHHLQIKPTRLSRAQLETLAIIAYRQPVTRPEIEHVRGVDCGASLKVLLDRNLVRITGKKEDVGRPLLYGTTREFLEFFKLKSLLELPTLREFQELTDEHRRQLESEFEAQAPLGNLRELAEGTPKFAHDDSALIADLDGALNNAKQTVTRVAELTGLNASIEDDAKAPESSS